MVEKSLDLQAVANLIAEISWLNHTGKIFVRVNARLAEAIKQWKKNPTVSDVEMILPILNFFADDKVLVISTQGAKDY